MSVRTFFLTLLAMIAFAANSVIGRMGLVDTEIGPGAFAMIRVISGAVALLAIFYVRRWRETEAANRRPLSVNWQASLALSTYVVAFAFAYLALSAGTGALILFGVVQIVMIGWGVLRGERLSLLQWLGAVISMSALVWLVLPGTGAPHPVGAFAMALAGIGWAVYSLVGRGVKDAAAATTGNFIGATPIVIGLSAALLLILPESLPDLEGVLLAVLSGAVTSGAGYVIWYAALKNLRASAAAVAQLSVPALAALGGAALLSEPITARLWLASIAILGGIALTILTPRRD